MKNQSTNPKETTMDISKLLDCGDQLGKIIAHFEALQPATKDTGRAVAQLAITHSYISELATHLTNGMELEDALQATALGDLKIGESTPTSQGEEVHVHRGGDV